MLNTPDDRSGLIVIFAAVGVSWSVSVLVTRLSGSISRRRGFGMEDWGIVASTVSSRKVSVVDPDLILIKCMGVTSSIAIFAAVKNGLGRSSDLRPVDKGLSFAKVRLEIIRLYEAEITDTTRAGALCCRHLVHFCSRLLKARYAAAHLSAESSSSAQAHVSRVVRSHGHLGHRGNIPSYLAV